MLKKLILLIGIILVLIPIRSEAQILISPPASSLTAVTVATACSATDGQVLFISGTSCAGDADFKWVDPVLLFTINKGLSFAGTDAPITIKGGDDGTGSSALIIDNPIDAYLVLKFNQYVDIYLDEAGGGASILGSLSIRGDDISLSVEDGSPSLILDDTSDSLIGTATLLSMNGVSFSGGFISGNGFTIATAGKIRSTTIDGENYTYDVYDNNTGPGYVSWLTANNGNSPSVVIAPPAGGTTISVTSRYISSGATPVVTDTSANSCGSGTQTIVGNDNASKVTVIGSVGTSCTVTFATAFANAPSCNVTNETTANLSRATSTASDVIVAGTFLENDVLAISCLGR